MRQFLSIVAISGLVLLLSACKGGNATADASTGSDAVATPVSMKEELPVDPDHRIQIKVKGATGEKAYLAHYLGTSNKLVDSVEINNEQLVFEGDQPLDRGMYLVIFPPGNKYFEMIVDRDQHFELETDTADFNLFMKVKGSGENEAMFNDIHFLADQRAKIMPLQESFQQLQEGDPEREAIRVEMAEIDSTVARHRRKLFTDHPDLFYTKFLQAMVPPVIPETPPAGYDAASDPNNYWRMYYYRKHFFDNIDFSDDRFMRSVLLGNKVKEYMDRLTVKYPDSINKSIDVIVKKARSSDMAFQYFVPWLMNTYGIENKQMGMDAVFVHMAEKYYLSREAWWADSAMLAKMEERALALSPNLVGRPAPDFTATDVDGKPRSLHSMPGKLTILYFWDYDCGHCKTVTPKVTAIYPKYKDMGVSLFAVSINGDVEVWKEKLKEYNLQTAVNVQDHARSSGFDGMYDVRSTPRIFVLDENKVIRYKQIGVEDLEGVLRHELGLEEG